MGTAVKQICIGHYCLTEETSRKCISVLRGTHPVILSAVSISAAFYIYQLFARFDAIPMALAALAGTSAFINLYMALTEEETTPARSMLHLLAAPLTFALAVASLSHGVSYLIGAVILQALVAANEMPVAERPFNSFYFGWANFNAALALLLF